MQPEPFELCFIGDNISVCYMDAGKSTQNRAVLQMIFVLGTKSGENTFLRDQLHPSLNMETVTTTELFLAF